jgi:hypothetical protein
MLIVCLAHMRETKIRDMNSVPYYSTLVEFRCSVLCDVSRGTLLIISGFGSVSATERDFLHDVRIAGKRRFRLEIIAGNAVPSDMTDVTCVYAIDLTGCVDDADARCRAARRAVLHLTGMRVPNKREPWHVETESSGGETATCPVFYLIMGRLRGRGDMCVHEVESFCSGFRFRTGCGLFSNNSATI